MRRRLLMLCLLLVPVKYATADEWMGLDDAPAIDLGLDVAIEDDGDLSGGIGFSLPLGQRAGFAGDYRNSELSDDEETFDSLALASAIWFELTDLVDIEALHFFEGNEGELEKETLGLALGLARGDWQFRVQLEEGELLIFTREDLTDFLATFVPDRFSTDVSGYALMLGWQRGAWYWQASRWRYDYEDDLSGLERSDFAQFIVKTSALAHSSLLVSRIDSLLVGRLDADNDYSLLLSRDRSAIDDSHSDSLTLTWQHWPDPNLGLSVAATIPGESELSGFSLGLQWVL